MTTDSALETYLATQGAWSIPLVRALDEAICAAGGELEPRYAYRMLLYSPPGWPRSRWLCGISTSTNRVHLRFLFGTSLPDPKGILRGGTSTLMSIDYASLDELDRATATAYVRDALDAGIAQLPPRQAEPEVSDDAVRRATGKGWDDWFRILDVRGLDGFSHRATAAWVATEHGVDGWWAQSVTVGYERARGLRQRHQTTDGFEVSVSKTLRSDAHRLWSVFADDSLRATWQVPPVLRIRTAVEDRSVRFDHGDDGSRILVSITPKARDRTTVTVTHERMAGPDDVEPMRAFWRAQLAALEAWLTGPGSSVG